MKENQNAAAQAQEKMGEQMPEQNFAQIGHTTPRLPPSFTFQATDSQAPELVLGYMQANFHRLSDADLYRTLGQAIEMRNFYRLR